MLHWFTYLSNSDNFIISKKKKDIIWKISKKKTPHLSIASLASREKSRKSWAAFRFAVANISFSNSCLKLVFFETLNFYCWQQRVSVVFLEVMRLCFPLFIFKKTSVKHRSSSRVQMVLREKSRSACECFPFGHTEQWKTGAQGSRFNKINNYAASSRMFLSENGFFFLVKNIVTTQTAGATTLVQLKAPQFYPLLLLDHQWNVMVGKTINISVLLWKQFWPHRPSERELRNSSRPRQVSTDHTLRTADRHILNLDGNDVSVSTGPSCFCKGLRDVTSCDVTSVTNSFLVDIDVTDSFFF